MNFYRSKRQSLVRRRLGIGLLASSLAIPFSLAVTGCGGHRSPFVPQFAESPSPSVQGVGKATVSVTWPTPSRLIPSASNSIVVTITKTDGSLLSKKILVRPADGGTTSATFDTLPIGSVIATVTAHPNTDGTGTIQASAADTVTIEGGQTATLSLTLGSTIDRLDATSSSVTLTASETTTLTVAAKNAAGEIVLTDPKNIIYSSDKPGMATVDTTGKITAGNTAGAATITVTEKESGKTATVNITVAAPSAPITQKSVAYQIDSSHSGRAIFGQPLKFPDAPAWSVGNIGLLGSPIIADGKVFVVGSMGEAHGLYAFDLKTGARLWGPVGPGSEDLFMLDGVAYDSGKVIAQGYTGFGESIPTLLGVDSQNGNISWRLKAPLYSYTIATTPPLATNGLAFFDFVNPLGGVTIYALDCATGSVRWKKEKAPELGSDGGPLTATPEGDILFLTQSQRLLALDLRTGDDIWQLTSQQSLFPAIYGNGKLYSQQYFRGAPSTNALILNPRSGTSVGTYSWSGWTPVFWENRGYFMTETGLKAVDQNTQQVLWSLPNIPTAFSPILIDSTLIVAGVDGIVRAIEAKNGNILWQKRASEASTDNSNPIQNGSHRTGMAAGEGYLVVPLNGKLTAWHMAGQN